MKRAVLVVIGIVLVLAGIVFTLQGLDVLGGHGGMNGNKVWAVVGPIIAIVGLVVVAAGARHRSGRSA
jgi:hypothetical protein